MDKAGALLDRLPCHRPDLLNSCGTRSDSWLLLSFYSHPVDISGDHIRHKFFIRRNDDHSSLHG